MSYRDGKGSQPRNLALARCGVEELGFWSVSIQRTQASMQDEPREQQFFSRASNQDIINP